MNPSKNKGTAFETAVVNFLRANGFPKATRQPLKGSLDEGDIIVAEGMVVECKAGAAAENASDNQLRAWCAETVKEAKHADAVGFLVVKRKGFGIAKADGWWVVQNQGKMLTRFLLGEYLEFLVAIGWTPDGYVEPHPEAWDAVRG